ncbi:transcriptional regulator [Caballeronia arvi]|uniref:Transcriptional regulator n=1 Tax=Caballeronia arvi TaxID=1777135 RepID=A0A158L6T0_9BURK|nr:transcriptional regulator [Caballeronia arvi]
MRTQTKRLNETPKVRQERIVTTSGETNLTSQRNVAQGRRIAALSGQAEHQGYRLTARAEPVKSALYAAHLVIEGPGCRTPRRFHALDYFYDPAQALRYAIRWGRIWVDLRHTKVAAERVASASSANYTEPPLKEERADWVDNHE